MSPAATASVEMGASQQLESTALVDYDNWSRLTPSESVEVTLGRIIRITTAELLRVAPSTTAIRIRLYGGWIHEGALTDLGSSVAQSAESLNPFPMPHRTEPRLVHGDVRLARSLLSTPSVELGDMFHKRTGPPRLRLSATPTPGGCVADPDVCPARILARFTRSTSRVCPAPNCPVTSQSAFEIREQKMVDTLLACDLLSLANDSNVGAVAVMTSDTDFLPPIVQGRVTGHVPILVISNHTSWTELQIQVFRQLGVVHLGPGMYEA